MKPGVKTSEFLAVLLFSIGALASSIADQLAPRYAAIGIGVAAAAYAISRGIAKHGALVGAGLNNAPPPPPPVQPPAA